MLFSRAMFVILSAIVLALNPIDISAGATSLKAGQVGKRLVLTPKRCGQNGVRSVASAVQVIVVGSAGGLNCIIRITEKLLSASDFKAGYACVSAYEAKPAAIVKQDDPRAIREKGYAENLVKAVAFADKYHVPVEVVYITTSRGRPHAERRCKKMLGV